MLPNYNVTLGEPQDSLRTLDASEPLPVSLHAGQNSGGSLPVFHPTTEMAPTDYDFSMLCLMLYIVEAATVLDQKASYFLLDSSKRMSCRCQKVISVIRKAMGQPVILCQPGVFVVHLKY